jgi:hypothetical protein
MNQILSFRGIFFRKTHSVNIYDVEHYKHFFRDHNNLVIPKKNKKKNNFFFINITKIFRSRKILKMENKHPEHFWSALNSLSENNKKLIFEIL